MLCNFSNDVSNWLITFRNGTAGIIFQAIWSLNISVSRVCVVANVAGIDSVKSILSQDKLCRKFGGGKGDLSRYFGDKQLSKKKFCQMET